MKRHALLSLLVVALLVALAAPASSQPINPVQLTEAGWTCFPVSTLGVHCAPPGSGFPPSGPVVQLLYFTGSDPADATAQLLGTETLIRDDVFTRRQAAVCPTDPSGGWFALGLPTGTYWACHRR